MRKSQSEIKERKETILKTLQESENYEMEVSPLAQNLKVSEMTIRRDLAALEKKNLVERFHGGARLSKKWLESQVENDPTDLLHEHEKHKIAERAVSLLHNDTTLFINSSTTAALALDFITDLHLTIISNNTLVHQKKSSINSTIMLTGGEIRSGQRAMVGDLTMTALSRIRANYSILGCSGISAANGISTNNVHEAKVNEMMIEHTQTKVIIVATGDKIGKVTNFNVTDLSKIDTLITDKYADTAQVREIEELGVNVLIV